MLVGVRYNFWTPFLYTHTPDGQHFQKSSLWSGDLALSGQVMRASGLMEERYWNCVIENRVCQRTRTSYGTLGCHPALNSP